MESHRVISPRSAFRPRLVGERGENLPTNFYGPRHDWALGLARGYSLYATTGFTCYRAVLTAVQLSSEIGVSIDIFFKIFTRLS